MKRSHSEKYEKVVFIILIMENMNKQVKRSALNFSTKECRLHTSRNGLFLHIF